MNELHGSSKPQASNLNEFAGSPVEPRMEASGLRKLVRVRKSRSRALSCSVAAGPMTCERWLSRMRHNSSPVNKAPGRQLLRHRPAWRDLDRRKREQGVPEQTAVDDQSFSIRLRHSDCLKVGGQRSLKLSGRIADVHGRQQMADTSHPTQQERRAPRRPLRWLISPSIRLLA